MRFKIRFQFTCTNWCKVTLVAFMHFFFQSGFSNCLPEQRQSHTLCIYAIFFSEWVFKIVFKCLQKKMQSCFVYIVRFSNASLNCLPEEMKSYIDCNCMIFLQSVFSNVPSNHLPELMHSHIGKGTPPEKKNIFFRALPKLPPLPLPLFRATCTSFSAVKNRYRYYIFWFGQVPPPPPHSGNGRKKFFMGGLPLPTVWIPGFQCFGLVAGS